MRPVNVRLSNERSLYRSASEYSGVSSYGQLWPSPKVYALDGKVLTRRKSRFVVAMRMNDLDMPEVVRQRLSSDSELEFASIFAGTCIADREWLLLRNSVLVTSVFTLAGLWWLLFIVGGPLCHDSAFIACPLLDSLLYIKGVIHPHGRRFKRHEVVNVVIELVVEVRSARLEFRGVCVVQEFGACGDQHP